MKSICKIVVNKLIEKEIKVSKKDDAGAEITVLEKVTELVPQNYILAKPTFSLKQESTLYYEGVVAECIKRGIFSTIQLRKRFVDDEGILASKEKKDYETLWAQLWAKKAESLKLNEDADKNKEELKKVNEEIVTILSGLQSIEERSGNSMLYEHTAEKIASDRTAIWWMLFLSYKDNNGKFEPVFGNAKYTDIKKEHEFRVSKYEEIEINEDPFEFELVQKLLLAATLWAFGKAEKQEDFDDIFAASEKANIIKPNEKAEEKKVE